MSSKGKSSDEKSSSDKENDHKEEQSVQKASESSRTYQKKAQTPQSLKQKVLSAKNGAMALAGSSSAATANEDDDDVVEVIDDSKDDIKRIDPDGRPWGLCLADAESCPVHSTILPKTYWAYYSSVEELDDLIEKLNPRGLREGDLKDKLTFERDKLVRTLKKFNLSDRLDGLAAVKKEKKQLNGDPWRPTPRSLIDISIRDNILELEEKLYLGSLGQLRVRDREAWQKAIQDQGYDRQCESLSWGGRAPGETPFESRLPSANASRAGSANASRAGSPVDGEDKRDSTGSSAEREEQRKVRDLACAMLQVSQMIDAKFLKSPLGEDEKDKKKRLKDEEKRKKVSTLVILEADEAFPFLLRILMHWRFAGP
jgi:bromodomain adjacent to zinc finger domain protein 1A